jgi:twinkle protein
MELTELKRALAERAEDVCMHLLPDGKREGKDWRGGRLANGDGGHSLAVVLSGDKAGIWTDHGGNTGGNNLLELWIQVTGKGFQDARQEAEGWLEAKGVKVRDDLRQLRKKTYSKPDIKGITRIANKAEFYLFRDRQIPSTIIEAYKIAMTDEEDAIIFPYLNETTAKAEMWKAVKLERDEKGKKVSWTSKDTAKVLFGKHTRRPDDRTLLICEGEIDAMTWRALLDKFGISGVCCCSVPFGAKFEGKDGRDPNEEWITNDWEFLCSFEKIVLSMDMDEEGRKAQASLVKRLGRELCHVIELKTGKDANELWLAQKFEELRECFAAAKTLDPAVLKNASAFQTETLDRMYSQDAQARRGIPLPFGNYPFHLRWHEWTLVTGLNGSGKTQLINFLLLYLKKLGYGSVIASMEVPSSQTLEFLIQQATGHELPERPVAEAAIRWVSDTLWFYDRVGRADWKDLLDTFRYAFRRYGCRFFVIDSLMKLGISMEDLDAQGEFATALSDLVRDLPIHVFLVAHPRKTKSDIEVVGKMDVKGSGELTDQAHNVWTVFRNKAKEREIGKMIKFKDDESKIEAKRKAKPDAQLIVGKQKNDRGEEPEIDLWFINTCKQFFGHHRATGIALMGEPVPEKPVEPEPQENLDEDVPF